jgi:RNA recognition motif-containing protein
MAKELYVGHISEQATEDDLRKLFSLMGPVTSVHLIVNQETGEFKRCGYVRMLASVDLKEVVETLDGTWLIDRCIVVSIAKPQKDRPVKAVSTRRKPMALGRPAEDKETDRNERPKGVTSRVKSGRPAAKDSAKTGRSSAAKESARPGLPTAANNSGKSGRLITGKREGDTARPPSKGRR